VNELNLFQAHEIKDQIITWRRHVHQHPELAYQEHATSQYVATQLKEMGFNDVRRGFGGTGLIAVLRATNENRKLKAILLRADMDALPITEALVCLLLLKTTGLCMHVVMMVMWQCCWVQQEC
jgi:metal-dependent amidase/aminoacylase/carboxypeptidase family protein